jgi:hypothetical protein
MEPSISCLFADTKAIDPWDDRDLKAALSLEALTLDTVEQPEESLEDPILPTSYWTEFR